MRAPKLAATAPLAAGGALLFVALFFGEGTSGGRLFWIGSFAVLAVASTLALGPVAVPRGAGLAALACLAGLACWTGLTIWWSIAPDRSWAALDRLLVYGAFAVLGLAVVRAPRPARSVAGGLAVLLALVLLWALAGKVVPSLFPGGARVARLRNPIGYWNSLALVAAAAVPLALWLASSRRHRPGLRAAGAVLLYLGELVAVLTYSRAGVAVAVVAAIAWLALGGERLESLGAIVVATPLAGLVALWAFSRPAITDDAQSYANRVNDGAWFGVILSAGAAVVFASALLAAARARVPEERRSAYALRLGAVLAVVGVAALAAVLVRGGGTLLDEFRGVHGQEVTQDPARLAELGSSNRWRWWQEAWTLFERDPVGGKGASTFEIARRDIREGSIVTTEPHNLPLRFLAETGIVGFLLLLGLGAAAATASVRTVRRLEPAERAAATALVVGLGAYALHALVDIDWEFVAVTAPAFFVLGVIVGLGAERRARRPAVVAVAGVVAVGALYALTAPYASGRLVESVYRDIEGGRISTAVSDARAARWLEPLSVDPLLALAAAEAARGREAAALRHYRQVVELQPENSSTWYALGSYEYSTGRYRAALHDLDRAYGLDPYGPAGRPGGLLDQARARVEGR